MKDLTIMDCTLRDGANVIGNGFTAELTKMIIEGLISSNIRIIEMGNSLGIGSYEANNSIAPLTDVEYLELIQPYLSDAEIGMFMGVKNANRENINLAAKYNLKFLRIGANAGDGKKACEGIKFVKQCGMKCYYSIMKAYALSVDGILEEVKMLAECGLDQITIMDSAGTMMPGQVKEYILNMVKDIDIPIGFHGHNNLGLSLANTLVAAESGATFLDSGLLGMGRSAGNCATEVAVAVFQRIGKLQDVDFYKLLDFIDREVTPAMNEYGYKAPISSLDLVLGSAGCHSSFTKKFDLIAREKNIPLYKLIMEVSKIDKKEPSEELIYNIADQIKLNMRKS